MMINATLVVQVLNFLLAYIILRFLFIKPVYALIQRQSSARQTLIATIISQKKRITQQEDAQRQELGYWQHYFINHLPAPPAPVEFHVTERTIPALTATELNAAQAAVRDQIIARIEHVA